MAQTRALLLEDDRLTAAVVRDWLEAAGWAVEHVESGAEGLRRIGESLPDLVVSDVLLPGLDGTAVCANLRLRPYGDRVRVVLLSARADTAAAARAAGADVFLPKPVLREELLAAVVAPALASVQSGGSALPRPVRLPVDDGVRGDREEGPLGPGAIGPLLQRLHAARFSGVLEAEGDGGVRAKLYFSRGCPGAARSSDAAAEFGQVLLALGLLSAEHLGASVEAARRSGVPLGEWLLRSNLVERRAIERALREQVLLRAVGIGRIAAGRYALDPAEPIGLAVFEVHPAAIIWRLGDPLPPPREGDAARFVRPGPAFADTWPLLDPQGDLGVLRALLLGGASYADCARVCGPRAAELVSVLRAWGVVELVEEAPPPARREAGLAELDATELAEELRAWNCTLLDANHYTVLGLAPDASADDVNTAASALLARLHPDALPAGLDVTSRGRARATYERAMEAGRVLSDPGRRAIYDAHLRGETRVTHGAVQAGEQGVLQADRAGELLRRGAYVTAAALFQAAARDGESADLLTMLGWARHHACPEDPTAGEAELRHAVQLAPDDENAVFLLARVLIARGEREEGRALLRRALDLNHEFEPARQALRELTE